MEGRKEGEVLDGKTREKSNAGRAQVNGRFV